jgi:hypothetical protein
MFEHVTATVTPGVGVGVATGVAVGVGAAVAVSVGATVGVGVGVAGRAVGVTIDPHAARQTAAIAVPVMVVSFMAALTPPLCQGDVGREHPESGGELHNSSPE